jgi:hypothetical protein
MNTPVYQLYTTGDYGHPVFIGTFSNIEAAKKRVDQMMLHTRKTWIELDFVDQPVEDQNIIWQSIKNESVDHQHAQSG